MSRLFLFLAILCIVACSPESKMQRLIAKHPWLAMNDTIRDTVRVTLPGDSFSEAVVIYVHDTVRIDTGRMHVRLIRVPIGSPCDTVPVSINASGSCDTVFVQVPIERIVKKLVPCPEGKLVKAWWKTAAIIMFILIALAILINRLTK